MCLNGIALLVLSQVPRYWVVMGASFVLGFATTAALTFLVTIIRRHADEAYMGRTFGVYSGLTKSGQILFISMEASSRRRSDSS